MLLVHAPGTSFPMDHLLLNIFFIVSPQFFLSPELHEGVEQCLGLGWGPPKQELGTQRLIFLLAVQGEHVWGKIF